MKLTLNIEPGLIEQMKKVAKKKNISLSKLTEVFYAKEIDKEKKPFKMLTEEELPEWVKSLTVVKEPTPDFDHKAEYGKHLEEKYGL